MNNKTAGGWISPQTQDDTLRQPGTTDGCTMGPWAWARYFCWPTTRRQKLEQAGDACALSKNIPRFHPPRPRHLVCNQRRRALLITAATHSSARGAHPSRRRAGPARPGALAHWMTVHTLPWRLRLLTSLPMSVDGRDMTVAVPHPGAAIKA
jgi:hypothetical protein